VDVAGAAHSPLAQRPRKTDGRDGDGRRTVLQPRQPTASRTGFLDGLACPPPPHHRHPRAIFHTGARVGPALRSRHWRAATAGGRSQENAHGCIFIGGSLPATISPPPQNHIHISTTMIYEVRNRKNSNSSLLTISVPSICGHENLFPRPLDGRRHMRLQRGSARLPVSLPPPQSRPAGCISHARALARPHSGGMAPPPPTRSTIAGVSPVGRRPPSTGPHRTGSFMLCN